MAVYKSSCGIHTHALYSRDKADVSKKSNFEDQSRDKFKLHMPASKPRSATMSGGRLGRHNGHRVIKRSITDLVV
jgi:hypothetical protein